MSFPLSYNERRLFDFSLGLFVAGIVISFVYVARAVLIPLALAILFALLLSTPMNYLQKKGVPKALAASLVVIAAVLVLSGVGWMMSAQMTSLASQLPDYRERITRRLVTLRDGSINSLPGRVYRFFNQMNQEVVRRDAHEGTIEGVGPNADVQLVRVVETESGLDPTSYLEVFSLTVEPLTALGLVFLFLIFMLIEREEMRNRLIMLIGHGHLTVTTKAIDEATTRTIRYLRAQFLINVGYGVVVAIALFFIGIPYALIWGLFAFCLRYVPLVGPWIAMVFPLLMSLIASEGWLQPLGVVGLFICTELVANLIFDPWLFGKSVGMSQTALVVAIAFWTWLWGAPGLVMAAPLTVCLLVMGKYIPQLRLLSILLGDEPSVPKNVHFYQRLLAHDTDEAANLAKELLKVGSLSEVCDQLFLPALVAAKQDQVGGRLSDSDTRDIARSTLEIFEEMSPVAASSATEQEPAATPASERHCVLVCSARDELDDAAAACFTQLAENAAFRVESANSKRLVSEIGSLIDEHQPAAVLLIALPPGNVMFVRLCCKRLRARFPKLGLVVARWGLLAEAEDELRLISESGASYCGINLAQTWQQIGHVLQYQPSAGANVIPLATPKVPVPA